MVRWSIAGRVAAGIMSAALLAAITAAFATSWLRSPGAGLATGALVGALLATWLARRLTQPWVRVIEALRDGVQSLRDHDFSLSIARPSHWELSDLVAAYNSLGDVLRRERLDLYQRELLLDTVIQATPLAMVLISANERVIYSNVTARQLFHAGHKLEGLDFRALLAETPAPLKTALQSEGDTLFTMEVAGEPQVYHLSQRRFALNARTHRLVLLKQLTRELAAQEVAIWKRVIRVIAHELNNSLAPIRSLAHSGRLLAREPDAAQLDRVFVTIADRAAHLSSFIDGYARFAKLPQPRRTPGTWTDFLTRLEGTAAFTIQGSVSQRPVSIDTSQLEQVMINLLKNAAESGSPPADIAVSVREQADRFVLEVADRGAGLSERVLPNALLPFFSTKPTGTGLGLTLCREIIEAHGGRLSIANRSGGGAVVTVWLPID